MHFFETVWFCYQNVRYEPKISTDDIKPVPTARDIHKADEMVMYKRFGVNQRDGCTRNSCGRMPGLAYITLTVKVIVQNALARNEITISCGGIPEFSC
jgi:hypothetical protein